MDPRGNIVLDSQADSELIFIRNVTSSQKLVLVGSLSITTAAGPITLDDTAFAPSSASAYAFMLVSDVAGDTIYRIDNTQFGFEPRSRQQRRAARWER